MKKVVIFDLDGTILDTLSDMKNSVNYVLSNNGFSPKTIEEIKSYVGNGIEVLMRKALPVDIEENRFQELFRDFEVHYQANLQNETKPYPGILELLEILQNKGMVLAVVSNKFQAGVDELVDKFFKNYISIAVGTSLKIKAKPAIDSIAFLKDKLNILDNEDMIFIGDSEVDIRTARNANLEIISVTWGFRSREELIKKKPDYIVDKPLEILEIL